MKLMLVGPTDDGFWHLENEHGVSWKVVERWEDHPGAAALFGWKADEGESEYDQVDAAREFLMENIGIEFNAPLHIAEYFEELERECKANDFQ